jgi:mono/diheme cytochrome c family protein
MGRYRPILASFALVLVLAGCSSNDTAHGDPVAGRALYDQHCASCHGRNLEGQPDWRTRLPTGRMPAPPHDDSGHTWHHADEILFGITKYGVSPRYAPPGYQSDMPAFAASLSDPQIRDVLAYIKSRWSPRAREAQAQIDKKARQ